MAEAEASAPPPTVLVDPQDPLPESNWLWRRVFVFAVTGILLAMLWIKIDIVGDVALKGSETAIAGLIAILKLMVYLVGLSMLLYIAGASMEQITKLIQTGSLFRRGFSTQTVQRAIAADGSIAEAHATSGITTPMAPPPPIPPLPAPPPPPASQPVEEDVAPR
jgi:hypothetical protein